MWGFLLASILFSCSLAAFTSDIALTTISLPSARFAVGATVIPQRDGFLVAVAGGGNESACTDFVDICDTDRTDNCWTLERLSAERCGVSAAYVGTLAVFAGGLTTDKKVSDVIDLRANGNLNNWRATTLSQARTNIASAVVGNIGIFAGGTTSFPDENASDRVDFLNANENQYLWYNGTMPKAIAKPCAVSLGDLAIFAGGNWANIYNASNALWSTQQLAVDRSRMGCAAAHGVALFCGGQDASGTVTRICDVYELATNSWGRSSLPTVRTAVTATSLGQFLYFSGGLTSVPANSSTVSFAVDVYDVLNKTWLVLRPGELRLQNPRISSASVTFGSSAFIAIGGRGFTSSDTPITFGDIELVSCIKNCVYEATVAGVNITSTIFPVDQPTIPIININPTVSPPSPPTDSPPPTTPTTSTPTGTSAPTVPPPAQCTGPWIPVAAPGSVSSFCSSCTNGSLFLYRVVDYSQPECQNVSSFLTQDCSFPCPLNASNPDAAINISQALLTSGYLQSLLQTLSIPVSQVQVSEQADQAFLFLNPCNGGLNMSYVRLVISNLLDEIYAGRSLPFPELSENCTLILGKYPAAPRYGLFAILGVGIVLFAVFLLVAFLAWYYYGSPLHYLPYEIAWSFLDKLSHPWRWTNRIEYHIRSYERGSPDWRKVQRLLADDLVPLAIHAVYNPRLTVSFINQWRVFATRLKESPELFFRQTYTKNEHKVWVMQQYDRMCQRWEWNTASTERIPLVPVFHGTDFYIGEKIAQTGFAVLSTLDAGFYGKGIYFTSTLLYTLSYAYTKRNPAVIISYINPGNVFPVTEDHRGPKTLIGGSLKQGYSAHFVVTNRKGCVYDRECDRGTPFCNEIVVGLESQILPAFIFTLDERQCEGHMRDWSRDTPTPQDGAKHRAPKSQRDAEQRELEMAINDIGDLSSRMYSGDQQLDSLSESQHTHVNMESEEEGGNGEKYYLLV